MSHSMRPPVGGQPKSQRGKRDPKKKTGVRGFLSIFFLMFNVFSNPENIWEKNRLDCNTTVPLFFPQRYCQLSSEISDKNHVIFSSLHWPTTTIPPPTIPISTRSCRCQLAPTNPPGSIRMRRIRQRIPQLRAFRKTVGAMPSAPWIVMAMVSSQPTTWTDKAGPKARELSFFEKKNMEKKHRFLWEKKKHDKNKNKNGLKTKTDGGCLFGVWISKGTAFFSGVFNKTWYWLIIWGVFCFDPFMGIPMNQAVELYGMYSKCVSLQLSWCFVVLFVWQQTASPDFAKESKEKKIGGRFL